MCYYFGKFRNDEVTAIYKLRGMSKEHFQLIQLALAEVNSGKVGFQHRDWLEKTQENFKQIDVSGIKM